MMRNDELKKLHDGISDDSVGFTLYRHDAKDNLLAYECVELEKGASAVRLALRRARISGKVVLESDTTDRIETYFADINNEDGDITNTVLLDKKSFTHLKYKFRPRRLKY